MSSYEVKSSEVGGAVKANSHLVCMGLYEAPDQAHQEIHEVKNTCRE